MKEQIELLKTDYASDTSHHELTTYTTTSYWVYIFINILPFCFVLSLIQIPNGSAAAGQDLETARLPPHPRKSDAAANLHRRYRRRQRREPRALARRGGVRVFDAAAVGRLRLMLRGCAVRGA